MVRWYLVLRIPPSEAKEKKKQLEGHTLDSGCQHIEVKHKGV